MVPAITEGLEDLVGVVLDMPTPVSFAGTDVIFQLHSTKFHMLIPANQT